MGVRARGLAALGCVLGLVAGTGTAHAGDPFHGTFTTGFSRPPAQLEADLAAQASTGAGTLREHVHWDRIERAPGVFDFAELDDLVSRAAARGMTLLPVLVSTPQFHSTRPAGLTTDGWPPRDPGTMTRFAFELSRRYGSLGTYWGCVLPGLWCKRPYRPIRAWQVWNEPDQGAWWRTGRDPAAYHRLLVSASLGLRLGDPATEVVLAGLSLKGIYDGYLDELYDLGAALWFDTLALHPYSGTVSGAVGTVRHARAIATAKGDGRVPIRLTEYGFATGGVREWVVDEPCQAALVAATTREFAAQRAELGLRGIVQFQWQDRPGTSWPNFAGLLRADGTAKPSLAAYADAVAGRPPAAGSLPVDVCPVANRG